MGMIRIKRNNMELQEPEIVDVLQEVARNLWASPIKIFLSLTLSWSEFKKLVQVLALARIKTMTQLQLAFTSINNYTSK